LVIRRKNIKKNGYSRLRAAWEAWEDAKKQMAMFEETLEELEEIKLQLTEKTYSEVLTDAGLSEYIELFERNKLTNVEVIRLLTNEDLREMGIEAIGDRIRILSLFQQPTSNTQQINATPSSLE
jgi:hypothetical protein